MGQPTDINSSHSNEEICRELTLLDVQKALFPLSKHREICSMINKTSCCALVRLDRHSSRLLLPLARRSRTDFSNQPSVNLCSKCHRIKEEQHIHLRRELEFPLISTDQNDSSTLTTSSSSTEKLVWNLKSSDPSIVYDTGSLTDEEKKTLLHQTLTKLQLMLLQQSSTYDDDHQRTVCRTLQRTIEILSSSIESNRDGDDDDKNNRVK